MDKVFKIGVVGCGRIFRKHIDAIKANPQCSLAAVCDISPDVAKQAGDANNAPWFTSLEETLSKVPDIDIVSVLTPSGSHAEHTIIAARAGKHVIVEKPMALSLEDAEAMIRECDQNNVKLFVVKQNRYNRPIVALRHAFGEGAFGRLNMGSVRVRWRRDQSYYDLADWRGTWAMDGGVFANQASHHIDMLQWFMGEVESVYAQTATYMADIEVEDTGFAILKFTSGAMGLVEATTAARPVDLEGSLSLLGENGTVVIGGFAMNKVDTWNFANRDDNERLAEELNVFPENVYGYGHKAYYQNACESLCRVSPALVDGWEGYKSLRLIIAMYKSAETGQQVDLAPRPNHYRLGNH